MTAIEDLFSDVRRQTGVALERLVPAADVEPTRLHSAVRWSLFAGGKRVRPAIVFAVGRTFGARDDDLITTAAAVEMIHTYSLIHDDLPAMDDDDLRRGKPTCHKQFDEATAILAGDVLQTLAFKAVADDPSLSAEVKVSIIAVLTTGAGTPTGMVSGQQLDLEAEGRELSLDEIEQIHLQKTGALIVAAASCGALIARASDTELAAARAFAHELGLLFQITDDILDVTRSTEDLGKTAGKDVTVKKATYPALLGLDAARNLALRTHNDAVEALARIAKNTQLLRSIADMVLNRTQ